jgi:hypothetical protein
LKSCFPGLSSPSLTTSSAICISKSVAKCEALGLLRACWVPAGCLPGASLNVYFANPSGSALLLHLLLLPPGCLLGASWVPPGCFLGASRSSFGAVSVYFGMTNFGIFRYISIYFGIFSVQFRYISVQFRCSFGAVSVQIRCSFGADSVFWTAKRPPKWLPN